MLVSVDASVDGYFSETIRQSHTHIYSQTPIVTLSISGQREPCYPPHNPNSTEYCKKMSGIFQIFYCNWNIVATFLLNIAKYFIATLQFQLSKIFLKTNKYLILLEIL